MGAALFDDGNTFRDASGREWTRDRYGAGWSARMGFALLHVSLAHAGRPRGPWNHHAVVGSAKRDLWLSTPCRDADRSASREEAMAAAVLDGEKLIEWVKELAEGREEHEERAP